MNLIKIDLVNCSGCGACTRACFINVLRWNKSKREPVVAYPEDCVHCNACEISCPENCIAVTPDFDHLQWSAL